MDGESTRGVFPLVCYSVTSGLMMSIAPNMPKRK